MNNHTALRAAEQRFHNQTIQLTQAQDAVQAEARRREMEVSVWDERYSSMVKTRTRRPALKQNHASAAENGGGLRCCQRGLGREE